MWPAERGWGGGGWTGAAHPKTQPRLNETLEEGVVFLSAGQSLRRFHKLFSECRTSTGPRELSFSSSLPTERQKLYNLIQK